MPYSRNWLSQLWDDSTVTVEKFKEVLEEGRPSEVDDSSIGAETGGFHPELLHSISFSGGAGLILILAFMYFMYRRCNSCGCKDQVQQQHQPQQPDLHLEPLRLPQSKTCYVGEGGGSLFLTEGLLVSAHRA